MAIASGPRQAARLIFLLAMSALMAAPLAAEEPAAPGVAPGAAGSAEDALAPGEQAAADGADPVEAEAGAAGGGPQQGEAAAPAGPLDAESELFRTTLPLDISTATFYELAAWARSLGLPDSGSAEELRARLYSYYGVQAPKAAGAGGKTVRIERAGEARYFKLEGSESEIVRASGGVILSLEEEGGAKHRIEASEIIYDRARNAVTARGSVSYSRSGGGSSEMFTGEALSADLDDWSAVFLDGRMRRSGEGPAADERGLVMAAQSMTRRSSDILLFEQGVISSCDAEDPHYAVRASKVWLLGDNEWAVSNALFSIGNVPILWLPFFYYPGDEIVFHPVIGYRSREGRFVQTTTYLKGSKPPKAKSTGILSFAEKGKKEGPTEVKGLFLRKVESSGEGGTAGPSSGKASSTSGESLKIMGDLYSNLGAFLGVQGALPKLGPFDRLDFSAGLGLSRSLFKLSGGPYSPFAAAGNWSSVWNKSEFLGLELPLRFGLEASAGMRLGGLSLSASMPLFSDPFFDYDFKDRSEDMDWFSLFTFSDTSTTKSTSTRSSLSQRFEMSYSWRPAALGPWISSVDLTRLSSSLAWGSKAKTVDSSLATLNSVDPARQFFYPSTLRPFDAALSLRGKLFSYPAAAKAAAGKAAGADEEAEGEEPAPPLELRLPWPEDGQEEGAKDGPEAAAASKGAVKEESFRLPTRAPSRQAAKTGDPWAASLDWSLGPSAYYEGSFANSGWKEPADIGLDFSNTLLSYKVSGTLDGRASYRSDLVSTSLGLAWASQAQSRPYELVPGTNATQDRQFKSERLSGSFKMNSRPLTSFWLFAQSSLGYGLDATLYSVKYDAALASTSYPYKTGYFAWDKESITSHSATATLSMRPLNLGQSLALAVSLPPTTESYSARLALDAGPADLSMQTKLYRKTAATELTFDPLGMTLVVGASPWPVFSGSYSHDLEEGRPYSGAMSLTWKTLTATLNAKRSRGYTAVAGTGWKVDSASSESFRPTDLALSFAPSATSEAGSTATWSVKATSSLSQNILRFTEASLSFGLAVSLKVPNAIELSLSSQSQNSSVWRYYAGLFPPIAGLDISAAQKNPITDIAESLAIWDVAALKRSLFKLKSLSLKMKHELHDWDLNLELSAKPYLLTAKKTYVLDVAFSLLLAWRDISDIKTKVEYSSATKPLTY